MNYSNLSSSVSNWVEALIPATQHHHHHCKLITISWNEIIHSSNSQKILSSIIINNPYCWPTPPTQTFQNEEEDFSYILESWNLKKGINRTYPTCRQCVKNHLSSKDPTPKKMIRGVFNALTDIAWHSKPWKICP